LDTFLRFPGHKDVYLGSLSPEQALVEYEAIFKMTNFNHMVEGQAFRLDHNFEAPITEDDTLIILFKEYNEIYE